MDLTLEVYANFWFKSLKLPKYHMSITRSDEGVEKGISEMGVGLEPREGSDGGQTRDQMEDRTGGIGLGGSNGVG